MFKVTVNPPINAAALIKKHFNFLWRLLQNLTRGPLSASWFVLCKIYNEKVTLKKKFHLFLKLWLAKDLESNKESASYTEIKIKPHKTLHSFPFRNSNWQSKVLSQLSTLAISEVFLKQARSLRQRYKTRRQKFFGNRTRLSSIDRFEPLFCFWMQWGDSFKQHCELWK